MQDSPLTRDEMERRRLAAARELLAGESQASVARKFGVSRTTASRWQRALADRDIGRLRKRRATGRPCRLTPEQRAEIVAIHAAGPRVWGFDTDRWTTTRLCEVIHRRFGVRYDPDHVGRLMHRLGLRKRGDAAVEIRPEPQQVAYGPAAYPHTAAFPPALSTTVQ